MTTQPGGQRRNKWKSTEELVVILQRKLHRQRRCAKTNAQLAQTDTYWIRGHRHLHLLGPSFSFSLFPLLSAFSSPPPSEVYAMRDFGNRCTVKPLSPEGLSDEQPFLEMRVRKSSSVDEALEHLNALMHMESQAYLPGKDYLSSIKESSPDVVSEGWRRKLCEWCYEVVDHFGFDREAVFYALNFLDRAVAARSEASLTPVAKREFQLLAVTSLYMSLKIHGETETAEGPRRKLRIDAFVELSRGFFQVDVIEDMESKMLDNLRWKVNPPTCLKFVSTYLRFCPKWSSSDYHLPHANVVGGIYDVARYLCELSVCVSSFSFTCKTSTIAYASILCAIEALQSSLPLPYAVRVAFQNSIAEANGLLPNDQEVLRVRAMLKELCPNMFEGDEIPAEFLLDRATSSTDLLENLHQEDGKASPVCVMDVDQRTSSHRKRSRSFADDSTLSSLNHHQ